MIFADSFYFLALVNRDDPASRRATAWASAAVGRQLITTDLILIEVADALSRRVNRHLAVELLRSIDERPDIRVVPIDRDLLSAGLDLYAARPDKDWSLTDCVSFVVMARDGVAEALTGDRHFAQAGFTPLLA